MNYEMNRLNTFNHWPSSSIIDPGRIAKAGFFYTGQGVEVQCFCCGGKISEWNCADQVMARHRRLDPSCPFVVNPQLSGNVPLGGHCQTPSIVNRENNEENVEQHFVDYGLTEEDDVFKSDTMRLLSFANWNDAIVSREALVIAGFYHTTQGKLRCAWCGGELVASWTVGSLRNPIEIHRRYFPGCTHAAELEARDAATLVGPMSRTSYLEFLTRSDPAHTTQHTTETQPQTEGSVHNARVLAGAGVVGGVEGVGVRALGVVGGMEGARHPPWATLASRLDTYTHWPHNRTQTPQALADAGFFYTGTDDQVRCFYCDGGLGKWEAGDTPWREHARWFPHCGYLTLVKGRDFVTRCRAELKDTNHFPGSTGVGSRRLQPECRAFYPVTEAQVVEQIESGHALAALGAGLDVSRVRRAIANKLRLTGLPFSSAEALIDAALDQQLNEEAWPVPASSNLAEQISRLTPSYLWEERSTSRQSQSDSSSNSLSPTRPANPLPQERPNSTLNTEVATENLIHIAEVELPSLNTEQKCNSTSPDKVLSLEEENRQLKEARLCKVCMDSEVSVVFLPCGHLVVCGVCGAGLSSCPLCRGRVQALVRAYLA